MRVRIPAVLLSLLVASAALGQTADLTLAAKADPAYNAGDPATISVTVTNLGPDAATAAGVRLPKLSMRRVPVERFGCFELIDSVLCNVPTLAAGQSQTLTVPFIPPDVPGTITLTPRTESFAADPNHANDSTMLTANVVSVADLQTTINVYPGLQPGKISRIAAVTTNIAAQKATGVRLSIIVPSELEVIDSSSNCVGGPSTWVCAIRDLGPSDSWGSAMVNVRPRPGASGKVNISATADSTTEEWNRADNAVTTTQGIYPVPELDVRVEVPPQPDDANRAPVKMTFVNDSDAPALGVTAVIGFGFDSIASFTAQGWDCRQTETFELTCSAAVIAAHSSTSATANVQFRARELRTGVSVTVKQRPDPDFQAGFQNVQKPIVFYRSFEVTTTADSGPGSLRDAITNANAQCSDDRTSPPCRINFEIAGPVPDEGWFTIEPLSPLPTITVNDVLIDGEMQTAVTGDTNPAGPEIFVRGNKAGESEGLRFISSIEAVRGLAIGGFARNGIESLSRLSNAYYASVSGTFEHNYIGVDPTGSRAVPNGLRGIMAWRFSGSIAGNVISGNRRSGIWLTEGDGLSIVTNRIGVAARSDEPIPNGATGLFFFNTSPFGEVKVQHNVIAFNEEYGISSTKLSRFSLYDNVVAHNRIAIDLGLDGPSPDYYNGFIAPIPVVTSARYDAASGTTAIEGVIPTQPPYFGYATTQAVYLYANTTAEQGAEAFIGSADVKAGHFSLTAAGDLRGKYIDATTYMTVDYGDLFVRMSSEFGPTVLVSE